MKSVPLAGKRAAGRVALVDDADYPLVAPYHWSIYEAVLKPGWRPVGPYAVTMVRREYGYKRTLMHKHITGYPMTDHINHDGLDNRRANLRPATQAQNQQNQRPRTDGASKYKGVSWHRKTRKWQSRIGVGRQRVYLGLFTSEESAARAYNAAAIKLHGEFACLNVIEAAA